MRIKKNENVPKSPKVPKFLFLNLAPNDLQLSSISIIFFLQNFFNFNKLPERPKTFMITITLVFELTFEINSSTSTFKVFGFTSTKFNF